MRLNSFNVNNRPMTAPVRFAGRIDDILTEAERLARQAARGVHTKADEILTRMEEDTAREAQHTNSDPLKQRARDLLREQEEGLADAFAEALGSPPPPRRPARPRMPNDDATQGAGPGTNAPPPPPKLRTPPPGLTGKQKTDWRQALGAIQQNPVLRTNREVQHLLDAQTQAEAKLVFRQLSRQYHPDSNQAGLPPAQAEAFFKLISVFYTTLPK